MKRTTVNRIVIPTAAAVALLILNFRRDVSRAATHLLWQTVERKTLHKSVSAPGVMEAATVALIKSEVDETVIKNFVGEGTAVHPDQPLLELSRTHTQLEYEQKKNSYSNAESDYKRSIRELSVQRKLYRDQAVAQSQVEEAARAVGKNRANRDIAFRELKISEKKLAGTLVRSPLSGVVLKTYAPVDTAVTAGKELVLVGDISHFLVRTKVDELDIKQVVAGQPVEIRADAYADQQMEGVVRTVAIQAEREAFAKIEVVIDITNSHEMPLKHNLSVRVNILTEKIPQAVGIPVKAIQRKEGDDAWIYVRTKLGLITERKIKLGRPAGEEMEVVDGVSPGELVGIQAGSR